MSLGAYPNYSIRPFPKYVEVLIVEVLNLTRANIILLVSHTFPIDSRDFLKVLYH
jgi:hypothetical protein